MHRDSPSLDLPTAAAVPALGLLLLLRRAR
jgi:hypothetical protein